MVLIILLGIDCAQWRRGAWICLCATQVCYDRWATAVKWNWLPILLRFVRRRRKDSSTSFVTVSLIVVLFSLDGTGHIFILRPADRVGPLLPRLALLPPATIPNCGTFSPVARCGWRHPLQPRPPLPIRPSSSRIEITSSGTSLFSSSLLTPFFTFFVFRVLGGRSCATPNGWTNTRQRRSDCRWSRAL